MPNPLKTLRAQQIAFANHLRDPAGHAAPPGIDARRLAVYRELFANNIDSLLSSNFPVIRKTLGNAQWTLLVQAFSAQHRCETPLFPQIGQEFIAWLQQRGNRTYPWLAELAHYEWIELALQIDASPLPAHDPRGDLLAGIPMPSPYIACLAYAWPVHRIGPQFQPTQPPAAPSLLLARRSADHAVRFSELSPLVYRLLELVHGSELTGAALLHQLAQEAGVADVQAFVAEGAAMLTRLREEGTLLGVASA